MAEVYISTDIEADGPIPGDYSMLSLGAAAFDEDGNLLGTFSANLLPIPGAAVDPATARWWAERPEAYAAATEGAKSPEVVMREYKEWIQTFNRKAVFLAYPAGFDFLFVYWYLMHFTGSSPFSFSALDIKSYAMAKLGSGYRAANKRNWPKRWKNVDMKHSHVAVEDAIEQGLQFFRMKQADSLTSS